MTDETSALPAYTPDAVREERLAKSTRPGLTTDKPARINFRVTMRKGTQTKHYPRKARKKSETPDRRDVKYY
jgi:hypothetical protein